MSSTQDSTQRVQTAEKVRKTSRPKSVRRTIRRPVMIRRVDPFSILKISLIFYFCMLLVAMLGVSLFWSVVESLGVIDQVLALLSEMAFEVEINFANIGRALFLFGLLNVVLFSAINVFLAFLYNLVSDLLGGLKLTLAEDVYEEA